MPRENRVLHIGDPAPDFRLRLSDGREVRLSDYRGRQHILLFFLRGTW
ncbi:MAG: redoxin domain-containing protein [candidate division NC10 bacterium]|nr:redoxin domain-containing protein [candidate division NC10 bacterium]